ncbi:hypothetical protein LAZ67_3005905 [Cordylochernes scorpioides]|uniref:Transposase n=1 Tax=Cordylochernes scorpioides TaxID=51811 RepID=A0ABY6KAW1_9ARAC|nr:hypothetical protein LAZ67_3005905 [Cordylochernes scorpioides]
MLNKAFPNDAPKRTTVFEWHSRFKAGRISIEDDPRQGRPKFQRTDENVQKITDLIKENPRTTLLELEQDTGISKTTIGRIVTEDLKLKKTPAKFIPRFLTNEQKLCRLATCEDMMEMTRTNPEWKDKIITGDETWVYGYDPETKPQSAEWRDIAPNDFFLFPKLKAVLKGRHFDTRDDIIEKSPLALKSIPKEAYKNCFDNWEKRWRWIYFKDRNRNNISRSDSKKDIVKILAKNAKNGHYEITFNLFGSLVGVRESHHAPTTTTAPSTFHIGFTTEPVKVDRMTEDNDMQRMTEAGNEYFADALTNMQPHCEDRVSRLKDAMRGLAAPRTEEVIIAPIHISCAANIFLHQLEQADETHREILALPRQPTSTMSHGNHRKK